MELKYTIGNLTNIGDTSWIDFHITEVTEKANPNTKSYGINLKGYVRKDVAGQENMLGNINFGYVGFKYVAKDTGDNIVKQDYMKFVEIISRIEDETITDEEIAEMAKNPKARVQAAIKLAKDNKLNLKLKLRATGNSTDGKSLEPRTDKEGNEYFALNYSIEGLQKPTVYKGKDYKSLITDEVSNAFDFF